MIRSTQKLIKIGTSGGVTIPAKEMKREGMEFGDNIDITAKLADKANADDTKVIEAAKDILSAYKKDFENLSKR